MHLAKLVVKPTATNPRTTGPLAFGPQDPFDIRGVIKVNLCLTCLFNRVSPKALRKKASKRPRPQSLLGDPWNRGVNDQEGLVEGVNWNVPGIRSRQKSYITVCCLAAKNKFFIIHYSAPWSKNR